MGRRSHALRRYRWQFEWLLVPKSQLKKGLTNGREHGIVAQHAKVAQLVEHSTENAGVVGSIPSLGILWSKTTASSGSRSGLRQFCLSHYSSFDSLLTAYRYLAEPGLLSERFILFELVNILF